MNTRRTYSGVSCSAKVMRRAKCSTRNVEALRDLVAQPQHIVSPPFLQCGTQVMHEPSTLRRKSQCLRRCPQSSEHLLCILSSWEAMWRAESSLRQLKVTEWLAAEEGGSVVAQTSKRELCQFTIENTPTRITFWQVDCPLPQFLFLWAHNSASASHSTENESHSRTYYGSSLFFSSFFGNDPPSGGPVSEFICTFYTIYSEKKSRLDLKGHLSFGTSVYFLDGGR